MINLYSLFRLKTLKMKTIPCSAAHAHSRIGKTKESPGRFNPSLSICVYTIVLPPNAIKHSPFGEAQRVRKSKHSTNNCSSFLVPFMITNSSPFAVIFYLNSSFINMFSPDQAYF